MPRRRKAVSFQALYNAEREKAFSQAARGMAGLQGRPDNVIDLTPAEEKRAWEWTDPNVTVQDLVMIEQKVMQALSQETDDHGNPLWTDEQIKDGVRAQQDRALHPLKYDMIELTHPTREQQVAYAKRAARRFGTPEQAAPEQAPAPYTEASPPPTGSADTLPAFAQGAMGSPTGGAGMAPPAPAPAAPMQAAYPAPPGPSGGAM